MNVAKKIYCMLILGILILGVNGSKSKYITSVEINTVYWGLNENTNIEADYELNGYSILVNIDYPAFTGDTTKSTSDARKYYTSNNKFYVDQIIGLEQYDYYVSIYGPFLSYVVEELSSDDLKFIEYLEGLPFVSSVLVTEDYKQISGFESTVSDGDTELEPNPDPTPSTFIGRGIKVGILEYAMPFDDYFLDKTNGHYLYNPDALPLATEEDYAHVTYVTECILETAPAVDLYYGNVLFVDVQSLSQIFDWFILNGVSVVNISMGGLAVPGSWCSQAQVTNFYPDVYGLTICVAGGNFGYNEKIASFAAAPNVITVGSLEKVYGGSYIYDFATYTSTVDWFNNVPKPNIIANGDIVYNDVLHSGTSFASPRVVAAVARLMEQDPNLKTKPHVVMAILQATANRYFDMPITDKILSNGMSEYYGAGQLDYNHASQLLYGNDYKNDITDINWYYDDVMSFTIPRVSNHKFSISLVQMLCNKGISKTDQFNTSEIGYISFEIYKDGKRVKAFYFDSMTGVFNCTFTTSGDYTIKVIGCYDGSPKGVKYAFAFY